MAGIIGSALGANPLDPTSSANTSSSTAAPADTSSVTSATNTTDANGTPQMTAATVNSSPQWNNTKDQTVAGQVADLTAAGSPVMQQAKTNALEGMNSRGLLNSSMAETAGQSAVLQSALPIAQADAGQASKVAQTNVTNANADQTANMAAQNTAAQANLTAQNQQNVANTEAQYKQLTQGSASAATILNNAQQSINAIVANDKLDATAKNAAIANIRANLQDSMNMIGALSGDVNLGSFVNQATA